jgi:hypothetical protein
MFVVVASPLIRAQENLQSNVRDIIVTSAEGWNMFNEVRNTFCGRTRVVSSGI